MKPELKDGWYCVKILEESDTVVPLQLKFGMWYDSRGLRWDLEPLTVGRRIPDEYFSVKELNK